MIKFTGYIIVYYHLSSIFVVISEEPKRASIVESYQQQLSLQQFGSMEFWEFVLDDGEQYGEGAERFYQVGEEGRIRVRRFNAGMYI